MINVTSSSVCWEFWECPVAGEIPNTVLFRNVGECIPGHWYYLVGVVNILQLIIGAVLCVYKSGLWQKLDQITLPHPVYPLIKWKEMRNTTKADVAVIYIVYFNFFMLAYWIAHLRFQATYWLPDLMKYFAMIFQVSLMASFFDILADICKFNSDRLHKYYGRKFQLVFGVLYFIVTVPALATYIPTLLLAETHRDINAGVQMVLLIDSALASTGAIFGAVTYLHLDKLLEATRGATLNIGETGDKNSATAKLRRVHKKLETFLIIGVLFVIGFASIEVYVSVNVNLDFGITHAQYFLYAISLGFCNLWNNVLILVNKSKQETSARKARGKHIEPSSFASGGSLFASSVAVVRPDDS